MPVPVVLPIHDVSIMSNAAAAFQYDSRSMEKCYQTLPDADEGLEIPRGFGNF